MTGSLRRHAGLPAANRHRAGRLCFDVAVTTSWDEEFHPTAGARRTLQWAREQGADTLGEAYDLLDQLEVSNDVPEVLGHDDTVDQMREELAAGIEAVGEGAPLDDLA